MITRARFLWIVAALLSTLNGGCGTSGSRPTLYPEVSFVVQPSGPAEFTAELMANGVTHTFSDPASPDGTLHFKVTTLFTFFFEDAAPPYQGIFTLQGGERIDVTLTVPGQLSAGPFPTCGVGSTLTLPSGRCEPGPLNATPGTPPARPATQEIRFDVCVPLVTPGACFTSGDVGIDKSYTGSVGDASQTHLLSGTTPSIYFLEGAQDNVNAIFRLTQVTGDTLVVQLFIDGALEQTDSKTGSSATSDGVHIRQDL
jgi:hypothetical protein